MLVPPSTIGPRLHELIHLPKEDVYTFISDIPQVTATSQRGSEREGPPQKVPNNAKQRFLVAHTHSVSTYIYIFIYTSV